MNVQKKERVEDSLEQLMGGEEEEKVEDLFDKIDRRTIFRKLTIVCYKRECVQKKKKGICWRKL